MKRIAIGFISVLCVVTATAQNIPVESPKHFGARLLRVDSRQWELVSFTEGNFIYVGLNRGQYDGKADGSGTFTYWENWLIRSDGSLTFDSMVSKKELDCQGHRWHMLRATWYRGSQVDADRKEPYQWEETIPGTVGDQTLSDECAYLIRERIEKPLKGNL